MKNLLETVSREERRKAQKLMNITLKRGKVFKTAEGKKFILEDIDSENCYFKPLSTGKTAVVALTSIKKMTAFFFIKRTADIKEMFSFNRFSSIIFGLLSAMFRKTAKLFKFQKRYRLTMLGCRVYLAGTEGHKKDLELYKSLSYESMLHSYYYCRKGKAWRGHLENLKLKCIMDCGSVTLMKALSKANERKTSGKKYKFPKPIELSDYINFIKTNSDLIEGYFVLDVLHDGFKADHKATMENLKIMEEAGLKPWPVYHFGTPIEELDKIVSKGYDVIGLGGLLGGEKKEVIKFLDKVFSKYPDVAFHGLGITRYDLLLKYPFFSTDSIAHVYVRRRNRVLTPYGQRTREDMSYLERIKKSLRFLKSLENPNAKNRLGKKVLGNIVEIPDKYLINKDTYFQLSLF